MNFNLKDATKRKKGKASKKPAINFGLNTRKPKASSVFQGDDEDDNNNSHDISKSRGNATRDIVNRELAAEQAALRKRAEKAISELSSKSNNNMYDYDADYEAFSSGHQQKANENKQSSDDGKPKESRYIASLLKKAKEREHEREIIMERKIAREQEAEDNKHEFLDKDKFITKGYKRVLEEREAWIEKDKKQSKIEEEEDVTKRKGFGVTGFYSNFSHNVAVGGVKADDKHEKPIIIDKVQVVQENEVATERLNGNIIRSSHSSKDRHIDEDDGSSVDEAGEELKEQAIRAKRMQKIFDARDRYLKRIEIEQ